MHFGADLQFITTANLFSDEDLPFVDTESRALLWKISVQTIAWTHEVRLVSLCFGDSAVALQHLQQAVFRVLCRSSSGGGDNAAAAAVAFSQGKIHAFAIALACSTSVAPHGSD